MRKFCQVYLGLVPLFAVIIAFGIGHSSYKMYIPVWIIHSGLMAMAARVLGIKAIKSGDSEKRQFVNVSLFLLLPWVFFTIFAGMGPPPGTASGWIATAMEQQIRYFILILGGVVAACGLSLLNDRLKKAGEGTYSQLGFIAFQIAIPLFVLNMAFWGCYLVEASKTFARLPPGQRPEWYVPTRELFYAIGIVEVVLIYLATAAFAVSLKTVGLFRPSICRIYVFLSFLGAVLAVLPPSLPEPLGTAAFLVCIPAIPFVMPFLMGVNLLRVVGD